MKNIQKMVEAINQLSSSSGGIVTLALIFGILVIAFVIFVLVKFG